MTDPLDTKKIRLLLADYDDTIRRYESGLLVSDNYYHGLQTAIIKHAPALLDEIETLSDHVLQLQGGWAHEGNQSLAEIERLTAENEELNGLVGVNPRTLEHEINRLTVENERKAGEIERLKTVAELASDLLTSLESDDGPTFEFPRLRYALAALNPEEKQP